MKQQIALVAMLAVAGSAFAQATVKDDGQWRAALGLSASMASGNTKATNIAGLADAVRATKQDKWAMYANALYGRNSGATTADQLRLGTKYDWNLSPQMYAFGSGDVERDGVKDLSSRLTLGGGLGYRVINTDPLKFEVFGGAAYVSERWSNGGGSNNYPALILGEESNHKLGQSTTAKQRLVITPNLKDSGEYNLRWDAGISMAATAAMNVTMGVALVRNSNPPAGMKTTDTLFTTGVSIKFE